MISLAKATEIRERFVHLASWAVWATDFKIWHALRNTPYWGSYMTDIFNDSEEMTLNKMMQFLKGNPDFEKENLRRFRDKIDVQRLITAR